MRLLPLPSWEALEAQITTVLSESPFDQLTIDNTRDLVSISRSRCAPPSGVGRGYWETLCLHWPGIEPEVFGDRFEFYRFYDGSTDIFEFSRRPGGPVPESLIELLPPRTPGES